MGGGANLSALTPDTDFSCQSRIPKAHPPTSSTSHRKKIVSFSLLFLTFGVCNQHSFEGAGPWENTPALVSRPPAIPDAAGNDGMNLVFCEWFFFFLFFVPLGTL